MKKWLVLGIIIVLLAAGIGFFAVRQNSDGENLAEAEAPAEVRRQAVSVELAEERVIQERLSLHGIIAPWAEVHVVPKMPGRVAKVAVEVGDKVTAGDLLVQLEDEELALQVKQAQAAVASAEAAIAKIQAGARPEEVEQAEAALEQAEAGFENARLTYERAAKLHEAGVMAGKDWDGIKAQYEVAKAQKQAALKTVELVKLGARPEDLASAKAGLAQAKAALGLAELARRNTSIRAPITGAVNKVSVQIGDMAGSGPAVHIVDTGKVKLNLQVSEREVLRLDPGQSVKVALDAQPDVMVEGKLQSITPAADMTTGLFSAAVELTNSEGMLKPGMYGTAHVVTRERESVLSVPERAVFTHEGRSAVFVVKDDFAALKPVTVGAKADNFVEIISGIEPNDEVVTRGREFITDGALVRVVERGAAQ
ncbi:MAG: efflux RND transporter periplasmic adaptor subunit [Firmicutes bacterium]|nr:efflux RND transporter periplasmic adaptor subunit [Bacillota bacterium]